MIFALGIVLAFLPSLTWLFFYLKEDPHPEPPRWLWLAFLLGFGTAALSFYIERAILKISSLTLQQPETVISEALIFMIFGVALVEEVTKFLGARMLLAKNPVFDEPVDAMIYLITIALGFAALENILVLNQLAGQTQISQAFGTLTLRFLGANFLHTLASGTVGYYWAKGILERNVPSRLFLGLALATILHSIFNLLIIKLGPGYFLATSIFLFIIGLIILRDFETLKHLKTPATLVKKSESS